MTSFTSHVRIGPAPLSDGAQYDADELLVRAVDAGGRFTVRGMFNGWRPEWALLACEALEDRGIFELQSDKTTIVTAAGYAEFRRIEANVRARWLAAFIHQAGLRHRAGGSLCT